MSHAKKLKSSQTGFLNITMSLLYSNALHSLTVATVSRSQSNRAQLWDMVEQEIHIINV